MHNIRLGPRSWIKRMTPGTSVLPALAIALFPKCMLCWTAYFSLFSALGLGSVPHQPWFLPAMFACLGINLVVLYRSASKRNGYLPFLLAVCGVVIVALTRFVFDLPGISYVGIGLIFLASVLHALPRRQRAAMQSNEEEECTCARTNEPFASVQS